MSIPSADWISSRLVFLFLFPACTHSPNKLRGLILTGQHFFIIVFTFIKVIWLSFIFGFRNGFSFEGCRFGGVRIGLFGRSQLFCFLLFHLFYWAAILWLAGSSFFCILFVLTTFGFSANSSACLNLFLKCKYCIAIILEDE